MKFILISALLILSSLTSLAQTKFKLEGKITDDGNKTSLPGVNIYSKENPNLGTVSDKDGKYSMLLPKGKHTIVCKFIGFEILEVTVDLNRNEVRSFQMKETALNLGEVVITSSAATERVANVQIGVEKIEISEMAKMPVLFGERDIMKSIQLLPGIKSEGDGSSGYQVRGGTSSQNLILLDDVPIYNSGHLMGFFSAFNDDVLANASLYKGQIPAQFGGATSSVFDISTKNGSMQNYSVNGSIGLLSAKLNVEGPIVKDKVSFLVAARRSYLDLFLKLTDEYKNTTLNFYDLNAKISYNISENDMLFLSFFSGKDNMGLDELVDMKWGNNSATLRWFHKFNSKLYTNTSLIYSTFTTDNGIEMMNMTSAFDGYVKQGGVKESMTWTPNQSHNIKFGFQSIYYDVKSAEWSSNYLNEKETRSAWENTIWINEDWKINEQLEISAGIRLNSFSALGGSPYYIIDNEGNILETLNYSSGEIVKTHFSLEPRASINYRLTDRQSIKTGYSRTSQNIHAIRNSSSSSMPFDRYAISSNIIKPQIADQVSLGYVQLTGNSIYEFSVEGYYKTVDNVYDYKDGKSFTSEIEIERLLLGGKGRAYGIEFSARKNLGKLTGWIAYTLSWSENKIEGINNNQWYTAGNDRRHDISIVAMYPLSDKWHLAATWVYNTGQALTAPSAKYEVNGETLYYYAERNGYRTPSYHRLDITATFTQKKKRHTNEWSFGIYNAYNRYNPYIIMFEDDDTKATGTKTSQYSLFGIVPSISYNFKF
ncbi:TonB-dependent receptor [Bacteroidales bacterium OttesenSCG-928-C19]|nr:TonB-dependent receptor [Bacteroidales bacterium OttesenSCG-928-C19]